MIRQALGRVRQAQRTNASQSQTAVGRSVPAPVGGWNASSALADMKPSDAVILDNWIPRAAYVEIRKGTRAWVTGAPGPVETLMTYRGSSPDELYAVSDGDVYDATSEGAAFESPVYTGLSNSRVQFRNFANDGGQFLICVNGEDTPFRYNGSGWATLPITGTSGSIILTSSNLIDVEMHKRRLFFVEKDSLRVWFLEVNAIQGEAQLLDLGPVFQLGGSLQCIGTWTLDNGTGVDDLIVFITDQGEVAVYQGTDPADDTNWVLSGVYHVGIPLGRRALFKFGGDLNLLTTVGVIPLSQALRVDRAQENTVAITAKIQNAFSQATQSYQDNFGWFGIAYQKGSLAIYNIPTVDLTEAEQYVQNLQTGSWCRFTGLNAICWAIADDNPYFGSPSGVYRWDTGVTDAGVTLTADLKTAFNYFGDRGRQKRFTMLRPTLNTTANIKPAVEMLVDFHEREPVAVPTTIIDRSLTLRIQENWTTVTGLGYCGAVRMRAALMLEAGIVSELAIGDGDLVGTGDGYTIATDSGEPVDAQIQFISANVLFQPGGQL